MENKNNEEIYSCSLEYRMSAHPENVVIEEYSSDVHSLTRDEVNEKLDLLAEKMLKKYYSSSGGNESSSKDESSRCPRR